MFTRKQPVQIDIWTYAAEQYSITSSTRMCVQRTSLLGCLTVLLNVFGSHVCAGQINHKANPNRVQIKLSARRRNVEAIDDKGDVAKNATAEHRSAYAIK